ncbi:xanthine dehydrogenase [Bradyrhizobium sp. WD16]|uniref:xanthine dehydrogenase n=1 Tax=Bradyrhizobium sp. WD16 TaxID=1521768 RepID=UPI0020A51DE4|nr:xanthine dehydrogenase [Bradyrhizobium sp. WD16]UTD26177.1 xanthine dehydrogenase [Bradyrhizobium sp. WD16]
MDTDQQRGRRRLRRSAVILGTNEIASAVAVALRRNDYDVVMSHDPSPPVIRRKMAFHDALFGDPVSLGGIAAERVDSSLALRGLLGRTDGVIITELGLLDLIVIQAIDLLVDARLQKYAAKPDLRRLARSTVGLGPGFVGGQNCDIAVETRPGKAGTIIEHGATDEADGVPGLLGEAAAERFVRAEVNGRWHTAVEIGTRVYRDFIIGHLANIAVPAPFDGLLRGVVRDDTEVLAGSKLLEIDPRGRAASATEIDDRVKQIAAAVIRTLALREAGLAERSGPKIHLVK